MLLVALNQMVDKWTLFGYIPADQFYRFQMECFPFRIISVNPRKKKCNFYDLLYPSVSLTSSFRFTFSDAAVAI